MVIVTGIHQHYTRVYLEKKVVSILPDKTYTVDYQLKLGEYWQEQSTQIITDEQLSIPRAAEILKDSLRDAVSND
ncbi:hypothetical protein [Virgibacillus salexigens]|uniref:hypothetical protein n=1 Tax=Virgibacillus TaxID=84406 RepID=UPI00136B1745|nr:hypothetical protein [Virgibacillus massiliensis]MYL41804.1 hypothetical protein [Virgibacillus massiliensis]